MVEGVKLLLSQQKDFLLCGHARNYDEVAAMANKRDPAILLLDLNLKKEDGFSILQKIKTNHPVLKVIIFTMYEEAYLIEKAEKLKANGYVLKSSSNRDLLDALGQVIKSEEFYLPGHLSKQKNKHSVLRDEFVGKMHLSPREIEIIKLIAQGKSAKEIAKEIFLSLHTVDTHRRNILDKLDLKNIADLTRFAIENHLT